MLDNGGRHNHCAQPGIDRVNENGLFILHQFPRQGDDDPVQIKAKAMGNVGESFRMSAIRSVLGG
jgi:hypothetical protein